MDMNWIQLICGVITILGGVFAMLKFLNKDIQKEIEILKEQHKEFNTEMRHTNNRLDRLYRVLLDKTYGKNIPEELR